VEQNPFKTLIDISDLLEMESSPKEVEKEVENILLRYNTELKKWYKYYSKKVEHVESEESFALTLRQVWRFFRDTKLVSQSATLSLID
jgi:tRNA U34 5-methylaminomethyl-2-thiouridine-forming methyltransferase MnmC